ncbi:hypothetical protein [Mesorhizobium sp.]|uniref:hypothetical protein n=1 Tax=Mesorhizobium sp. TaxID=1871066 RepID=UPI0025BF192D|nr:hypothetical protein [Mesorhizobium sp.]
MNIETIKAKWLIAPLDPGLERQPLEKIDADEPALLKLLSAGARLPARRAYGGYGELPHSRSSPTTCARSGLLCPCAA